MLARATDDQPLADNAIAPLWTPFRRRILYDTYDVTDRLKRGQNALAVTLGNGWYNPLHLRMWGRFNLRDALTVGRPCLIARLEIRYDDGTTRRTSEGRWYPRPMLGLNDIFRFGREAWNAARAATAASRRRAASCANMRYHFGWPSAYKIHRKERPP